MIQIFLWFFHEREYSFVLCDRNCMDYYFNISLLVIIIIILSYPSDSYLWVFKMIFHLKVEHIIMFYVVSPWSYAYICQSINPLSIPQHQQLERHFVIHFRHSIHQFNYQNSSIITEIFELCWDSATQRNIYISDSAGKWVLSIYYHKDIDIASMIFTHCIVCILNRHRHLIG